jgi:hypothetical protein
MPTIGTLFGNPGPAHEDRPPKRAGKKAPARPWKLNLAIAALLLVVIALIALLARGILGS